MSKRREGEGRKREGAGDCFLGEHLLGCMPRRRMNCVLVPFTRLRLVGKPSDSVEERMETRRMEAKYACMTQAGK